MDNNADMIIINKKEFIDLINEYPNDHKSELLDKFKKMVTPGYSIELIDNNHVLELKLDGNLCDWKISDIEIISHIIHIGSIDSYEDLIGIPYSVTNSITISRVEYNHSRINIFDNGNQYREWTSDDISKIYLYFQLSSGKYK